MTDHDTTNPTDTPDTPEAADLPDTLDTPDRPEVPAAAELASEAEAPAPATGERIAKVMSRAGVASRRDAERMILEGRVAVNGKVITSPALDVTAADRVSIDGVAMEAPQETRLWLYYKPVGLVTSEADEKGRQTVFDALPRDLPRVMTVGRLDLNSEGLLLLTNDGALKRRLELPATGWMRRYKVRVNGKPNALTFAPLQRGVTIDGEDFQPMEVEIDSQKGANAWLTVGIREGRNREIRRALAHVGLTVNRLIRISYGPFRLGDMEKNEVQEVRRRVLRDQLGGLLTGETGPEAATPRPRRTASAGRPTPAEGGRTVRKPRQGAEGARDAAARPFRAAPAAGRDGGERPARGTGERPARKPAASREGTPFRRREDAAPQAWAERTQGAPRDGVPRPSYKPRAAAAGPRAGEGGPRRPPAAARDAEGRAPYKPRSAPRRPRDADEAPRRSGAGDKPRAAGGSWSGAARRAPDTGEGPRRRDDAGSGAGPRGSARPRSGADGAREGGGGAGARPYAPRGAQGQDGPRRAPAKAAAADRPAGKPRSPAGGAGGRPPRAAAGAPGAARERDAGARPQGASGRPRKGPGGGGGGPRSKPPRGPSKPPAGRR